MNPYQDYIDAMEVYERLYWANRARIALSTTRTYDCHGNYMPDFPESCIVYDFPARKVQKQNRPRRIVYLPSTVRGMQFMGQHERDLLERQKSLAPNVTPADVAKAKTAMSSARKMMKASKTQMRLVIA